MVRDLQDLCPHRFARVEDLLLQRLLGVSWEQHGVVSIGEPDHDRVVARAGSGPFRARARSEDVEPQFPHGVRVACPRVLHPEMLVGNRRAEVGVGGRGIVTFGLEYESDREAHE